MNRGKTTPLRFILEVMMMVARARRVGGQGGGVQRQHVKLVLPTIEGRAKAKAILQFQGLRRHCPVHDVEVAHFIAVNRSARFGRIYSFREQWHKDTLISNVCNKR